MKQGLYGSIGRMHPFVYTVGQMDPLKKRTFLSEHGGLLAAGACGLLLILEIQNLSSDPEKRSMAIFWMILAGIGVILGLYGYFASNRP